MLIILIMAGIFCVIGLSLLLFFLYNYVSVLRKRNIGVKISFLLFSKEIPMWNIRYYEWLKAYIDPKFHYKLKLCKILQLLYVITMWITFVFIAILLKKYGFF